MNATRTTRILATALAAVALAAAAPGAAFAKDGADDPAGHHATDDRGGHGGHGANDPQPHN